MSPTSRELFAHLAVALGRYAREMRRDGRVLPADVLALTEFFADCAERRQDAPSDALPAVPGECGCMTEHPLLTKREAAAALRTSTRTVERLIASGALAAVKVEGSTRVRRVDLDAYVEGLSSTRFRDRVEEKGA